MSEDCDRKGISRRNASWEYGVRPEDLELIEGVWCIDGMDAVDWYEAVHED